MKMVHHYLFTQGQLDVPEVPMGLYDYVITDAQVMLRAERLGLSLCLVWATLSAPLRGLADARLDPRVRPHVTLSGGKIPAEELLRLQAAARTPDAESFKETLFFLSLTSAGERRWWKPEQHRSWGMTEIAVGDAAYAQVVMELHTHPKGITRFSRTDDLDEHGFRLYAIMEDPDSATPLIRVRASIFGQRVELPARDVFDVPQGWRDGGERDGQDGITSGWDTPVATGGFSGVFKGGVA